MSYWVLLPSGGYLAEHSILKRPSFLDAVVRWWPVLVEWWWLCRTEWTPPPPGAPEIPLKACPQVANYIISTSGELCDCHKWQPLSFRQVKCKKVIVPISMYLCRQHSSRRKRKRKRKKKKKSEIKKIKRNKDVAMQPWTATVDGNRSWP
jgi:hypothetical protein